MINLLCYRQDGQKGKNMTNEEIIQNAANSLALQGKIKYTGRELRIPTVDGGELIIKETEPIHTFATWKEMGFMVKKGEHAVAKFPVWKYTGKKTEDEVEVGHCFMKTAAFFSASQVEPIAS